MCWSLIFLFVKLFLTYKDIFVTLKIVGELVALREVKFALLGAMERFHVSELRTFNRADFRKIPLFVINPSGEICIQTILLLYDFGSF